MTKILNFSLKIKEGGIGRVAHAKSSDPATPQKNLKRAQGESNYFLWYE